MGDDPRIQPASASKRAERTDQPDFDTSAPAGPKQPRTPFHRAPPLMFRSSLTWLILGAVVISAALAWFTV
ncbi:MAG: hypothetical protein ACM34F_13615, partial [Betaproteobacteria bacterium]